MKINNSTKKSLLIIALAMASTTYQTQAAPIEHIGDRYIMHVPEMELTGEESLLDVLMMCPEVISLDGNNIIGGDPFSNLYGKFVIRIDNQEYGLDYATFSTGTSDYYNSCIREFFCFVHEAVCVILFCWFR